jgi:hypothetical protein
MAGASTAGTSTGLTTRRGLLTGAGSKPPTDGMLIATMVQIEDLVAAVYERAIASGKLLGSARALAVQVLGHERLHAAALRRELRTLHRGELPEPRSTTELQAALATHHVKADLSKDRTDSEWLNLLVDAEHVLERNYHMTISELRSGALLTLCSEILGSEAQHSALLGELLSPRNVEDALPSAFINGYK